MAMVIAALCADGTSTIGNIGQIDRGYERMDERLRGLGAAIERADLDGGGSGADRGRPPGRELDRDGCRRARPLAGGARRGWRLRRQAGDRSGRAGGRVDKAGAALGGAFKPLLGQRGVGIVAADEALAMVVVEVSGEALVASNADLTSTKAGGLRTDLAAAFLRGLAEEAGLTIHVRLFEGEDSQHVLEAIFKALGVALADARPEE